MGYSSEVMQRARMRLAAAKADRESENQQHLAAAYERLPRLREIDRQLRMTMAMAAQAVFSQGGDVQSAMEEVKQKNLALQQERQQLVHLYFEEGYLDDSPICDRCGGSGYVGATMCECLAELCRQEQKKELTFLNVGRETFDQFRLEYYPDQYDANLGASPRVIMEKNFQICRKYAYTFSEKSGNLLFNGGTGLGKTFLSACIARTVADRGYSVVYESAGHLFSKLERAKFAGDEDAREEVKKYSACDLLIIDDLGTEMPGQFVTSALYNLLNDRLLTGKPMVISTNLNVMEELPKRYTPQVVSRLQGNFRLIPFVGEDIRVKKNWGL
ncbi:MAG: ATP-binding protein [Oscillospiraceae bacterium]|nr:ATP-binding protein [Oscillospiraceae bacterium]